MIDEFREDPWRVVTSRIKLVGHGPTWSAKCPAHPDRDPSMSISRGDKGVVMKCHRGCRIDDICRAIGIEPPDLFWPDDLAPQIRREPVVYTYTDEQGNPLIEVHKEIRDDGKKTFRQRKYGAAEWGLDGARRVPYRLPELLRAAKEEPVFIVEGEKDVENARLRLGIVATTKIGGAQGKWDPEWNAFFADRDVVVIADNDGPGRQCAEATRAALDGVAARLTVIPALPDVPEKGDLSDWIRAGGTRDALMKIVTAARLNRHPHVVLSSELGDRVRSLYATGFKKGTSTGLATLDEFYTVREGEWTVITGAPGSGKTSFLDNVLVNLAVKGWNFGIFSAENLPTERHIASLLERYVSKPFEAPLTEWGRARMEEREMEVGLTFIHERFDFIEPQESGQKLEDILEAGLWLVKNRGARGLVLDPWNELDHTRPKGQVETEYISESLTKIRRFARINDIHFFVVAHPQKLQRNKEGKFPVPELWDISGSAHWRNKADNGIVVERDQDGDTGNSRIHVKKIRFKEVGRIGTVELGYDKPTGRYSDLVTKDDLFEGGIWGGIVDDDE